MLLSVFTPTHDPAYLPDVWACLQRQTHSAWEWVVVPNGAAAEDISVRVMKLVGNDKRVRIVPAHAHLSGVGALKRFACSQCRSDVFVEYDHDDLITDDCLAAVASAVAKCPDNSFIYSDDVTMGFDGTSHKFMPEFGWTHYDWEHRGRKYLVNLPHEPTPRSLCEILFAPDHVRAWTRRAYAMAGGHNSSMTVGDDHDLIVRTYLTGAHFHHIRRPLYFHRLNKSTTSQENLELISQTSRKTRDKTLHALVKEWCGRGGLPMFDLGGAHNSPPGYLPIDKNLPGSNPYCGDVFDVVSRMPQDSVGCFRASDFLEHIPLQRVVPLMNLLYSRLVPGGYLLTNTPAVSDDEGRCGRGAYQDPTHCSFWSSNNTWYYTDRNYAKYVPEITCRFQSIVVANYYPSDWHKAHFIPYLRWDALALKDDDQHYYPGPKRI